jgi:hypothetical protein
VAGDAEDLSRRDVEHRHACLRQIIDGIDMPARFDLAAE